MVLVGIFFIAAAFLEAYNLIKKRYYHELKIFLAFSLITFCIWLSYIMGLPVINPAKFHEYIVKNILHLNYK